MFREPDFAAIAALLGEPARALMLSALMSGEALPATELAARAHVTPQTASAHLAKLVEGDLIRVTQVGRHRYYRLSSAEVARVLEALQVMAPPPQTTTGSRARIDPELCLARTCYDHLAGKLGVALCQRFCDRGYLVETDQHYEVTAKGADFLQTWDIDVDAVRQKRRKFAYACVDWSERRFHIAGALGTALIEVFFARAWVKRLPETRALHITALGTYALQQSGIVLPATTEARSAQ